MNATPMTADVPDHVPPALVVTGEVPGQAAGLDPYQQLRNLHDGPPLVYLSPCRTAPSGGWIVSRATDTRTVMQAPKLFSSKGITSFAAAVGVLAGFEKPTSGSVILNGVDIALLPPYERPINMTVHSANIMF